LVLIFYPVPVVLSVTREGKGLLQFATSPTPENKAQWQKYMRKYRIGFGLLVFGFVLQLIAAIFA